MRVLSLSHRSQPTNQPTNHHLSCSNRKRRRMHTRAAPAYIPDQADLAEARAEEAAALSPATPKPGRPLSLSLTCYVTCVLIGTLAVIAATPGAAAAPSRRKRVRTPSTRTRSTPAAPAKAPTPRNRGGKAQQDKASDSPSVAAAGGAGGALATPTAATVVDPANFIQLKICRLLASCRLWQWRRREIAATLPC